MPLTWIGKRLSGIPGILWYAKIQVRSQRGCLGEGQCRRPHLHRIHNDRTYSRANDCHVNPVRPVDHELGALFESRVMVFCKEFGAKAMAHPGFTTRRPELSDIQYGTSDCLV